MNENTPTQPGDIDLSYLDESYSSAEVKETEFEDVPDGRYQISVEKAEIVRAKSTGNPLLRWTLRVIGPTQRDRLIWKNSVLTTATMDYLKSDLHLCGVTLHEMNDLHKHLGDLLDVRLEVVKKTRGENSNIYFNKRILSEGASEYHRAAAEAKTPF